MRLIFGCKIISRGSLVNSWRPSYFLFLYTGILGATSNNDDDLIVLVELVVLAHKLYQCLCVHAEFDTPMGPSLPGGVVNFAARYWAIII